MADQEMTAHTVIPIHVCSSDPAKAAVRTAIMLREDMAQIASEAPHGAEAAAAIRAVEFEEPGPHHYSDEALADALVVRLNRLIANPAVRVDIERLLASRVLCSEQTLDHSSIQARVGGSEFGPTIGFLGVLNGLVGRMSDGHGHIAAIFDSAGGLVQFDRLLGPAPLPFEPEAPTGQVT